ncbi:MAG: NADH:ubiquinone oxidoreductase [Rikenellaceae bacterium]
MIFSTLKVLFQHGYQAIRKFDKQKLPAPYRGRPQLSSSDLKSELLEKCIATCPTGAITAAPFTLDMGRCIFCGECERIMPRNIHFTQSTNIWSLTRQGLVIEADKDTFNEDYYANEGLRHPMFKGAIKLRQVCAGGDGACEMEMGAAGNVNFDMRRFGIEFTASPRHSDGLVLTGAITRNMSEALHYTYSAMPEPRLLIAVGADAISGGLFATSSEIDRSFLETHTPNLYIAGHPAHPYAFIGGVRDLIGQHKKVARRRLIQEEEEKI